MSSLTLTAAVGFLSIGIGVASALLTPQGVRTSRAQEFTPAADYTPSGSPLFAWSQNSRAHPNRFNAFFKRGSHTRVKLNTSGRGFLGGIDPPLVVY